MRGLVVKPRARILHGHDWVLQVKSSRRLEPVDGDEVSLKAETGVDHIWNHQIGVVCRGLVLIGQCWSDCDEKVAPRKYAIQLRDYARWQF